MLISLIISHIFLQKTSGHIATKIKSTEKVVVVKRMGQIEPGESQSWNDVLLPIPPLPPTGLKGCSIIDIDYYVKVGISLLTFSEGIASIKLIFEQLRWKV